MRGCHRVCLLSSQIDIISAPAACLAHQVSGGSGERPGIVVEALRQVRSVLIPPSNSACPGCSQSQLVEGSLGLGWCAAASVAFLGPTVAGAIITSHKISIYQPFHCQDPPPTLLGYAYHVTACAF